MYALVDGNNFYVSCERAFRPALRNRPVVVLSNNDGCAIARSNEAKALGIKMGQPWHQCRDLAEEHGVVALSANFTLYGDMSDRMMSIAAGLAPTQEIYSIDECFLDLTGIRGDLVARGHKLRERILQWIAIPVGIGIGPTKTLAKLANHVAKTADRKPGSYPVQHARVCNLGNLEADALHAVMAETEVREVWGVGPRIGQQLNDGGVMSVLDLVRLDLATIRRNWSVVLERTVRELQGQPCIGLDDEPAPRKQIAHTRSFGHAVTDLRSLIESITEFTSAAAVKLRKQGSLAGQVQVFVHTSPFRPEPQCSRSMTVPLRRPTSDTCELVHAAVGAVQAIYRQGFQFAKAGVMLLDLQDGPVEQLELELDQEPMDRKTLMVTLDALNDRYGRGTVLLASSGAAGRPRKWDMRQSLRTPRYTTDWADVPMARA